jgi:hypothetical protein
MFLKKMTKKITNLGFSSLLNTDCQVIYYIIYCLHLQFLFNRKIKFLTSYNNLILKTGLEKNH